MAPKQPSDRFATAPPYSLFWSKQPHMVMGMTHGKPISRSSRGSTPCMPCHSTPSRVLHRGHWMHSHLTYTTFWSTALPETVRYAQGLSNETIFTSSLTWTCRPSTKQCMALALALTWHTRSEVARPILHHLRPFFLLWACMDVYCDPVTWQGSAA